MTDYHPPRRALPWFIDPSTPPAQWTDGPGPDADLPGRLRFRTLSVSGRDPAWTAAVRDWLARHGVDVAGFGPGLWVIANDTDRTLMIGHGDERPATTWIHQLEAEALPLPTRPTGGPL